MNTTMTMSTDFHEGPCTVTHEGREYTAGGAWRVGDKALAYVSKDTAGRWRLTDWHGTLLGVVLEHRLGAWRHHTPNGALAHPYRMAYVRVRLADGTEWWGRYSYDNSEAVRLKRRT